MDKQLPAKIEATKEALYNIFLNETMQMLPVRWQHMLQQTVLVDSKKEFQKKFSL